MPSPGASVTVVLSFPFLPLCLPFAGLKSSFTPLAGAGRGNQGRRSDRTLEASRGPPRARAQRFPPFPPRRPPLPGALPRGRRCLLSHRSPLRFL